MKCWLRPTLAAWCCFGIATLIMTASSDAHDIVVYGATPAGVAASVAAAREGKSVALIEPLELAGGMMSGGLGFSDSNQTARETLGGIFEEFHLRVERYYADQGIKLPYEVRVKDNKPWTYEPHVAEKVFNEMLAEAKVEVHLGESLAAAQREGKAIASIRTASGKQFAGKVFIDATYEGDLMAAAGVEYRIGRESRDEFDESLAGARYPKQPVVDVSAMNQNGKPLPLINSVERTPEGQGDKRIMTYSFRFCFSRDPANQVPFAKPADYDAGRYELLRRFLVAHPDTPRVLDLYALPNNKLDGNNGIGLQLSIGLVGENHAYPDGSPEQRKQIWAAHRSYAEGLFWFLKTDPAVPAPIREQMNSIGYAKDEFEKFGHFPPVLYVREARRMVGSYFLTQADIRRNATKPDSIGIGSFPIDSHDCQRITLPDGGFINEGTIFPVRQADRKIGHIHQIPYRAITPKAEQCTNLLVPVCLSASHVAVSSVRVEPTWMMLGQGAGIAAAVAVEEGVTVQNLNYEHLAPRLKRQGQLLNLPGHAN